MASPLLVLSRSTSLGLELYRFSTVRHSNDAKRLIHIAFPSSPEIIEQSSRLSPVLVLSAMMHEGNKESSQLARIQFFLGVSTKYWRRLGSWTPLSPLPHPKQQNAHAQSARVNAISRNSRYYGVLHAVGEPSAGAFLQKYEDLRRRWLLVLWFHARTISQPATTPSPLP
jgi:hypothetical protein